MTLEEEGAYIRAISYCWREGSIPADPVLLSRLLKNVSIEVIRTLVPRFRKIETKGGQRLVHDRLEKERRKQSEWRQKCSVGGKVSGKARLEKKLSAELNVKGSSQMVELNPNRPVELNGNSSSSSSTSFKYSRAMLEEIYEAYPRHIGKEAALKAIEKAIRKSGTSAEQMLEKVKAYAEQRAKEDPQFTPHPTTWFNQGRYEDDTLQPKAKLIWEAVQ